MPFTDPAAKRANDREWQRRHGYVQMNTWVPRDLRDAVNEFCDMSGISRRRFLEEVLEASLAAALPPGEEETG